MFRLSLGLILFILVSFNVNAANNEYETTREKISSALNSATSTIKEFFNTNKQFFTTIEPELEQLRADIDVLVAVSERKEDNPTILPHGQKAIRDDCDSKNQELKWVNGSWQCVAPVYLYSCTPNSGEYISTAADGTETCYQKGSYFATSLGFGVCNDTLGEKQTQIKCKFTNSKDRSSYQVEDNKCTNNVTKYRQPCGSNGGRSQCKCSKGTYVYENGQATCQEGVVYTVIQGKTYNKTFCTDHFTKIRVIPDGQYIEILFEAQNPGGNTDTRCGYGDYSSSWLNSKGLKGWARGAYMRVDRLYVGSNLSDIASFNYTYSSNGAGCRSVNGSGSGNSSSGSSSDNSPTHGYGFDNSSLTYCPGGSAQRPSITLTFNSIMGKRIDTYSIPICKM